MKASEAMKFRPQYLAPKYWGIWLGVGLLKILSLLPRALQFKLGAAVGRLLYHMAKQRRKIAIANIRRAFPALDRQQRNTLVKQNFESMGIAFVEMAMTWWGDHRKHINQPKIKSCFHYKGLAHLDQAKQAGKGALLLTPHFTHVDMTGLLASFVTDLHPVYKPNKNPLIDHLIIKGRTHGQPPKLPIDYKDTRRLVKTLREGKNIGYLPDQRYRGKGHLNVPFFGFEAKSHSATSKLAKMTGCMVIPSLVRRKGMQYELEFLPVLDNFPSGDDFADTLRLHQLYEQEIRHNPTQYLWVHNRWDLTKQEIDTLNQED
ncbi:lysophospholipid acyltransferase family protein [Thiomicrospira microaerophila]|uniref:lysophospholipid acyltransferase family protein n=1 Tax=Thiomicrospira microaerophila TaxID=406020 RepID=UPI000AF907EA|nr:lipid A biosynthesis acyltransferase [Thiomicrospira microaerophila]